jgi:ATP-dependent Clp protease protease subunit
MSIHKFKAIDTKGLPKSLKWDEPASALERWNPDIQAASDASISIYGRIGGDDEAQGVTANRISAALRSIGDNDVVVSINSPGGNFFEGVAIYNLLREHKNKVTVKVVGLAGSAASVVAMSADELQIAKSGFLMIHNSTAVVMGNRHNMRDAYSALEKFDSAMAEVYAARSGIDKSEVEKMMNAETWLSAENAVEMGLADSVLAADEIEIKKSASAEQQTIRQIEAKLAKLGLSRAERTNYVNSILATRDAGKSTTRDAGEDTQRDAEVWQSMRSVVEVLK